MLEGLEAEREYEAVQLVSYGKQPPPLGKERKGRGKIESQEGRLQAHLRVSQNPDICFPG